MRNHQGTAHEETRVLLSMNLTKIVLVGLGGCIGSIARYMIVQYSVKTVAADFPYGTLAVNIIGSLMIGLIYGINEHKQFFDPETTLFLTVGICGGFTTFSSFGLESFNLLRSGQVMTALLYITISNIAALLSVFSGYYIAKS